ncbi:MAG: hypothetical protein Q8R01_09110 [Ramlibacter sp.]|nr:hypothetical protein [Ramlibacter sp.]
MAASGPSVSVARRGESLDRRTGELQARAAQLDRRDLSTRERETDAAAREARLSAWDGDVRRRERDVEGERIGLAVERERLDAEVAIASAAHSVAHRDLEAARQAVTDAGAGVQQQLTDAVARMERREAAARGAVEDAVAQTAAAAAHRERAAEERFASVEAKLDRLATLLDRRVDPPARSRRRATFVDDDDEWSGDEDEGRSTGDDEPSRGGRRRPPTEPDSERSCRESLRFWATASRGILVDERETVPATAVAMTAAEFADAWRVRLALPPGARDHLESVVREHLVALRAAHKAAAMATSAGACARVQHASLASLAAVIRLALRQQLKTAHVDRAAHDAFSAALRQQEADARAGKLFRSPDEALRTALSGTRGTRRDGAWGRGGPSRSGGLPGNSSARQGRK